MVVAAAAAHAAPPAAVPTSEGRAGQWTAWKVGRADDVQLPMDDMPTLAWVHPYASSLADCGLEALPFSLEARDDGA